MSLSKRIYKINLLTTNCRVKIRRLLLANLEVHIDGSVNAVIEESSLFRERNCEVVEPFSLQIGV